ncbi:sugar transferase [Bosea sp. AS-1]|uniref:sugar transferase n=1 Tax=Bosea sp. AS-1 TaxID=2015316 RepID=UPI0018E03A62|nr:sugar transferase [Bosea sp. AS-1]
MFWTVAVVSIEMITIVACTYAAFLVYSAAAYGVVFFRSDYVLASIGVGALYVALCIADNQYDLLGPEWNEHSRSRGGAALALSFITLLTAGYSTNSLGGYSRGTFLAQLLATLLGQIAVRAALRQVANRARNHGHWRRENMAVLVMPGARGIGHVRARVAARHEHVLRWYDFPSVVNENAPLEVPLCEIRRECRALPIDAVLILFGSDNMEVVSHTVAALSELPVRIQLLPIELAEPMRRSRIGSYGHLRVLELFCGPCSLRDRFLKRTFDIVSSAALLTILWPLPVAVTALLKLDSRGPVLFKQMRLGFNNEQIQVLKFRSMICMEDARDDFRQAVLNDPRVTRVGRVLRRTNIDELPQLLNGLRGEADTFEKMQKRVAHDLCYVDNWSFFFDLKILVRTVISKQAYSNAY